MQRIRVFLACSSELAEERSGFARLLADIGSLPAMQRNFELVPVVWERDAFGAGHAIQDVIRSSVDFETLDVVVLVVWNKIGAGTRTEFDDARKLFIEHGAPRLLVFAREPLADAPQESVRDVLAFRKHVVDHHAVPSAYQGYEDFACKLQEQLPKVLLESSAAPGFADVAATRTSFVRWVLCALVLGVTGLFVASVMSFPGAGVSKASTGYVLIVQPLIFLSFLASLVHLDRLLQQFVLVWRSPNWRHDDIFRLYRPLLPGYALAPRATARVRAARAGDLYATLTLFLALATPLAAQYSLLFVEMVTWQVVVGRDVRPGTEHDPIPASRYVDLGGARTWFFGLQDRQAREHADRTGTVIYVHAHGQFGEHADRVRANLGFEVFIPWQARLCLLALIVNGVGVVLVVRRLYRLRADLAGPGAMQAAAPARAGPRSTPSA